MTYKARSGYTITVHPTTIELKKGRNLVNFNKDSISEVSIKKSPYDLPFIEKTLVIRLDNKKKYAIKRLGKKDAEKLYELITSL